MTQSQREIWFSTTVIYLETEKNKNYLKIRSSFDLLNNSKFSSKATFRLMNEFGFCFAQFKAQKPNPITD